MKRQIWYIRYILVVIYCIFIVISISCCGTEKEESPAVSNDNPVTTADSADEEDKDVVNKGDSSDPWTEKSTATENIEESYEDMNKDSILPMLKEDLGIDLSGYTDSADGVMRDSIYYVKIYVSEGAEAEIEQIITGLCGEGMKASSRKRPILNNRLSEDFQKAELFAVYDFLRAGSNGAKTTSVTFYTAKSEGRMSVFIFGTR